MKILPRFLATVAAVALFAAAPASAKTVQMDQATIAELTAAMAAGTLTAEKLVQLSIARIEAYDRHGPKIHAVITLNPKALELARQLDAERKSGKVRGVLHGIPVVLKDNYDTADMQTSGGSVLLEGSIPPDDAYMVRRLREAGAIILAKVNMSEFASSSSNSSLGGQSLNPHDTTRQPSGSSGGTGVAVAAAYAPLGFGTDTGGSIRGPSTVNGVVGLKPTHGLLSRDGIIPLALTFDTGGPLTRNVTDVAIALGTMTGVDPNDDATKKSQGKFEKDYTKFLNANALKGARIGIARDFMKQDEEVDWMIETALNTMKAQGATVVDVNFPKWLLDAKGEFYNAIRYPEFVAQVADYLKTLGPKYPKTLPEMIERAGQYTSPRPDGAGPNSPRWTLFQRELASGTLTDYKYLTVRDYGLPLVRQVVEGIFAANKLDAIVYPTAPKRPPLIAEPLEVPGGAGNTPANIANLSGFPDLIVPAGFTNGDLPVGISFLGTAFSEGKILALGYSYEQASHARRLPVNTPALAGEAIEVPDPR
ncbi:MAG: glutamyl-tRNA amidotransferase [Proteobacteria bacterium]|nr:glutamyl-tRNA amidotransferase [Pseudomonadota bacterium]